MAKMYKMNSMFFVIGLLVIFCSSSRSTKGIKKTTLKYKDGSMLREEEEISSVNSKCYQYTWLGPQNRNTDTTKTCRDLESGDEDKSRPCFSPLVWTFNDESSLNAPDPQDIVNACAQQTPPCDPTCTPTGGQTCIKYTLRSNSGNNEVARITAFCGRVILDGKTIDKETCHSEKEDTGYEVSVCSCNKKSKCNSSSSLWNKTSVAIVIALSIVLATLL